jgi:ribosomal protein S18 acetylase RimI-like enzyme
VGSAEQARAGFSWRRATDEDAGALVALIRAAYRGEASRAGWTSEAHLVEGERTDEPALLRLIGSPASRVMVVDDQEGRPTACCQLEDRGQGLAYFGTFAVDPARQATGLGSWLLSEAERIAAEELGVRELELTVLRQQAALIAWYERRGFAATGEARPFPADRRYARPLRDDLEFVVLRKPLGW